MTGTRTHPSWWQRYLAIPLIWKYATALVVGVLAGLLLGERVAVLDPLGQVFLRLLKMLVVPLVFLTLVSGVASISPATLGRVGGKLLGYYLVTSALAITIGLGLGLLVRPGAGLQMPGATGEKPEQSPSMVDTFLAIIPENVLDAMAEGNVLAVIFVAVIIALALGRMRHGDDERHQALAEPILRLVDAATEVTFKIVRGVLEYGPIGVFALIAVVIGETGRDALLPLLRLTGVMYGGMLIMLLAYAALLAAFGIGVRHFYGASKDAMVTAFVTRSSSGSLPVSMRAAERMGVKEGVYGFSLPLGATVNMDGTALYVGASTVFVANIAGVDLSMTQLLGVVAVGVLASIGTAGVPGAGLIMLSMAISQAGLPFAPLALVAGIDALLDMARTLTNVTGDLAGTRLVAQSEDMLEDPEQRVSAAETA